MASSISVRAEDRLEGVANFNVWKLRITNILQEHDLEQYVTTVVEEPTNNAGRVAFRKNQAKAKGIIFDSVKYNIMSAMTLLMTAKDCMDTLVNLYEKHAPIQKRTLKHKHKYLKIEKGESMASFYSRIAQIKDHLLVTRMIMDDDDLVQAIFYGLPSSWETFLSSVSGREIQPMFERLWHDCLQEESRASTSSEPMKEEHLDLTSRFKGKKKTLSKKALSRKALRGSQTSKVHSNERILIHLKLNCLVVISWVILLKIVGLERNIQGKGNIMPQLLRMMNPKEIKKVLLMRKKIENNITWFFPYPVQFSWGRKLG
jgi:hypothetical protein